MWALRHGAHRERDGSKSRFFVMTVDVDDWSSLLSFYSVKHDASIANAQASVEDGLIRLLEVFDKHEIKATFFVPGQVARKHSQIIREISKDGHEIACHGFKHEKNEFLLEESQQESNIKKATEILYDVVGKKPVGFRAPCLKINGTTFKLLEKYGYAYDSSVIPTLVPGYYGFLFAPCVPYQPSLSSIDSGSSLELLEMPISVNPLLPLSLSAAWMRNLGSSWVKFGIRMNFLLGYPVVFYVHPRDVMSLPRIEGVPWHLYRNVGDSGFRILDEIIDYASNLGAKFIKGVDFTDYWKSRF